MTRTRLERVDDIQGAIVSRVAEMVQESRTVAGAITDVEVRCDGDVRISGVTVNAGVGGRTGNHDASAAAQFDAGTDARDAERTAAAAADVQRQLERAGIDANLAQTISAAVSTEIVQLCSADAGVRASIKQQSTGSCVIENVTITQEATAAIGNCVQKAAVTVESATCPAQQCLPGTKGKCRGRADGATEGPMNVCYDPDGGGACDAGDVDCRQTLLQTLLLKHVTGDDDGDAGYDVNAFAEALAFVDRGGGGPADSGGEECAYDKYIIGLAVAVASLLLVICVIKLCSEDDSGDSGSGRTIIIVQQPENSGGGVRA